MSAVRGGFTAARKIGSGKDNKSLSEYAIASGYSSALAVGDAVKLHTDGTIIKGVNSANNIGVLLGVEYTDANGQKNVTSYWPASQTATEIKAYVLDDPDATFHLKADAAVTSVIPGDLYALTLTAPSAVLKRSAQIAAVGAGTVAAGSSAVKVIQVVDSDNRVLEVVLSNHGFRDDGVST